jgi:hypothetical protein
VPVNARAIHGEKLGSSVIPGDSSFSQRSTSAQEMRLSGTQGMGVERRVTGIIEWREYDDFGITQQGEMHGMHHAESRLSWNLLRNHGVFLQYHCIVSML